MIRTTLAVTALSIAFGSIALGGEVLRFKSGTVKATAHTGLFSVSDKDGYFIVQFKNRVGAAERSILAGRGAEIVRYIPDDALVVRAKAQAVASLQSLSPAVNAVVPYKAQWKISQKANRLSTGGNLLVQLFPGADSLDADREIRAAGAKVLQVSSRALIVRAGATGVAAVASTPSVEWVQTLPTFTTLTFRGFDASENAAPEAAGDYTDLTGYESGTKLMNFDSAWSRGLTGKGQIVAMADTGLDTGVAETLHGDFKGRVPEGHVFGMNAENWGDPMGHGTHVAGSVMGSGAASGVGDASKIKGMRGGAFEAQLIAQGMWSPALGNLTVPPTLSELFVPAYKGGARIHTNSWGGSEFGVYDSYAQQADEYMAEHPDMLVIFAAGNSGVDMDKDGRIDADSVCSPGTAKNVLTVGASKNLVEKGGLQMKLGETGLGQEIWSVEPLASSMLSENAQGLAPFSSRGPTKDGRLKPEIVAPGTNVLSVRSQVDGAEPLWGPYNKDYVWSGGTSMATPLTAGAAAVVRQFLVEKMKLSAPSAALIKAVLMHTAFDLYPGQFGEGGAAAGQELLTRRPNVDEGYGRVDVANAINLKGTKVVDEKTGIATGETQTHQFKIEGEKNVVVTLVYTDAAGSAGAEKTLVNDLDVVLVDSNGQEISANDHVNNAEMVESR